MASNYTTNYQLNQWEPTDAVQRVEFNQDNAKVDAALKSLSEQVVQKANQSALNTLISAVNQKADASTVSGLSQTVTSHTAQLASRGNCQIYYTSYVGDGTGGENAPTTVNFPYKPLFVMVGRSGGSTVIAIRGMETAYRRQAGQATLDVIWGEKSFSMWHEDGGEDQMNKYETTYYVVALREMGS